MVRTRFIGSGRLQEGGFLSLHKQDFEAHRTGGDWRHTADHIDMKTIIPAYPGEDVQETLELIADDIAGGLNQGLEDVLTISNSAGSLNIDMSSQFIRNMANPALPQDAATKWYVDQQISSNIPTLAQVLITGNQTENWHIDMTQGSQIISTDPGGDQRISGGVGDVTHTGGDVYLIFDCTL